MKPAFPESNRPLGPNRRAIAAAAAALSVLALSACSSNTDTDDGGGIDPPAGTATVFGIRSDAELVRFSPDAPGTVTSVGTITGLGAGESVVGLDFRPADGDLFAVTSAGNLLIVDPATAIATPIQPISGDGTALTSARFGVDFNPAANALRIVGDDGLNLRVPTAALVSPAPSPAVNTLVDGRMGYLQGVTAAAYTNPNPGSTGTALFVIDSDNDVLMTQDANVGRLTEVGALGIDVSEVSGYDIFQTALGNEHYAILTVAGVSALYSLDPATGAATQIAPLAAGTYKGLIIVNDDLLLLPNEREIIALLETPDGDLIVSQRFNVLTNAFIGSAVGLPVTGLQAGERLVGIDERTTAMDGNDGGYGVTSLNRIVALDGDTDPAAVIATEVGTLSTPLAGTAFGVDFNPRADLLRIVSNTGQNLRVNLQAGRIIADVAREAGFAFVDGTTRTVEPAPQIVATAYRAAPTAGTFQFAIDASTSSLVRVAVPNDGALVNVGPLGVTLPGNALGAPAQSLDIAGSSDGFVYAALREAGSTLSTLYTVDLATGAATAVGAIGDAGAVTAITTRVE